MTFQKLFTAENGGPSMFYRIPAIVTTKNGVTIACADARYCSAADNPNRIDKVVRRSTDSGETWGEYIMVVEEQGTELLESSAAIDPILTYNPETNRVFMHYSHTPAGIGIRNCQKNIGEENTSSLMMCYSDDDGLTWTGPINLNYQVKTDYMYFIGVCPGSGITLTKGQYKGRVIVPIYYGTTIGASSLSCCALYSDDNGETWKLGDTPNNSRIIRGKQGSHFDITHADCLTESQAIEQEDGTLKMFMRNHDDARLTATVYSRDGGETWSDFKLDEALPQPICQMSVIKLEGTEKPTVIFANPASKKNRDMGTLRLSEDDGETWPYSRLLTEGMFMYSSLTQLPDGNIGIFFEGDPECKDIQFVKVSVDWIKGLE